MTAVPIRLPLMVRLALVASAAGWLAACSIQFSNDAEAHDQWKKSYTLTQPGTLELRDNNGLIQIETADGNAVEVVADRTMRAGTEDAAKEALAHFEFVEAVTASRISIDASSFQSMMLGKSLKTEYHIRVPKWAGVTINTSNGDVRAAGLGGPFRVKATNGHIRGSGLQGGTTVTTTNGATNLDFAKVPEGDIVCETTNGEIVIVVPSDAKARISAHVTNSAIRHSGLELSIAEETKRRLDATIGGGGPMINLSATNGAISIQGKK
jgi:DUF4097 and DUF4098 domain-containing protein YvlB